MSQLLTQDSLTTCAWNSYASLRRFVFALIQLMAVKLSSGLEASCSCRSWAATWASMAASTMTPTRPRVAGFVFGGRLHLLWLLICCRWSLRVRGPLDSTLKAAVSELSIPLALSINCTPKREASTVSTCMESTACIMASRAFIVCGGGGASRSWYSFCCIVAAAACVALACDA